MVQAAVTSAAAGVTVHGAESIDNPTEPAFVAIRWLDSTRAFGTRGKRFVQVWAYDEPADYARIDAILFAVGEAAVAVAHYVGTDGSRLPTCAYESASEDIYDDVYRRIARYITLSVP